MELPKRELVRQKALDELPRWYVPWMHLTATVGVGIVTLVLGFYKLEHIRLWELSAIPLIFLLANFFEWRVHKHVLHRRRHWPLHELYDRHTPVHHHVYTTNEMELKSVREFGLILIPAIGVLGAVVAASPLAYLAHRMVSPNYGWLVLVTAAVYMVGYELSHLSYHLPKDSWIGRIRLVRVLQRHHAIHHDPALMQKWNFNVTIPLFDWIFGTIYKEKPEATDGAAARR